MHAFTVNVFYFLNLTQEARGDVVKYEPSLFFQKLCHSCMSVHALFLFLRSKLSPKSIPNPNESGVHA